MRDATVLWGLYPPSLGKDLRGSEGESVYGLLSHPPVNLGPGQLTSHLTEESRGQPQCQQPQGTLASMWVTSGSLQALKPLHESPEESGPEAHHRRSSGVSEAKLRLGSKVGMQAPSQE